MRPATVPASRPGRRGASCARRDRTRAVTSASRVRPAVHIHTCAARCRRLQRAAQVWICTAGRTREALVTALVRSLLAHEAPRRPGRDAGTVAGRIDDPLAQVNTGAHQGLGHGRAVEGALDHDRTGAIGLTPEFGLLVVHDQGAVSYTHLRAHETGRNLVCRLLL